ncbi:Membrane-bound inhibitor of C-type lysozyme [Paracoccus halophilus]|uniref:Membrane-bound inhibitor of C-type lysozyme n=1 Tax=Paracoccus halophilus TaxID=376733 RepID=A0A1I0TWM1_9RHOB|nr:MliC family protein [Paracoccus halophilus]SFA56329.1 Membrane-bound inhibitor of C-type lysozyme [Paracoccus halophilus]
MKGFHWAAALLLGFSTPALAGAQLSISLETGAGAEIVTANYDCSGAAPLEVQYINAGENSLALVPVEGEALVFVQVPSGSGARYVSGIHEWWDDGEGATLKNSLNEEEMSLSCSVIPAEGGGAADQEG